MHDRPCTSPLQILLPFHSTFNFTVTTSQLAKRSIMSIQIEAMAKLTVIFMPDGLLIFYEQKDIAMQSQTA